MINSLHINDLTFQIIEILIFAFHLTPISPVSVGLFDLSNPRLLLFSGSALRWIGRTNSLLIISIIIKVHYFFGCWPAGHRRRCCTRRDRLSCRSSIRLHCCSWVVCCRLGWRSSSSARNFSDRWDSDCQLYSGPAPTQRLRGRCVSGHAVAWSWFGGRRRDPRRCWTSAWSSLLRACSWRLFGSCLLRECRIGSTSGFGRTRGSCPPPSSATTSATSSNSMNCFCSCWACQ